MADDLTDLIAALRAFAASRQWEQFHTPKNLAMAITGEVGELVSELQWLTDEQVLGVSLDPSLHDRLTDEVADVLIYLIRFADVCGIDAVSAAHAKIARNEDRYPVDKARGNARKYTDLRHDGGA